MTIPQKIFFSFLFAAFLVAGITALDYTGVFNLIETRFHNPVLREAVIRQTAKDAEILNDILSDMRNRFNTTLFMSAARRSFLPDRSTADFYEISRLFDNMSETVSGLYSVCLVDTDGIQIFFSKNPVNRVSDPDFVIYRDYNENPENVPFSTVYVTMQEKCRLVLDKSNDRIIFSFPVSDEAGIQRGIALFSVSARTLAETFATGERTGYGRTLALVDNAGFVYDYPAGNMISSGEEILNRISEIWSRKYRSVVPLSSTDSAILLVSVRMDMGFYLGRIINESILVFPQSVKIFIFVAIYFTLFLIFFFLLNLIRLEHSTEISDKNAGYGRGLLAAASLATEDQAVAAEVIFEQDGIPYINSNAVSKNTEKKINNNFVKLVDSVISRE